MPCPRSPAGRASHRCHLLGGSCTEHGQQQLRRRPQPRRLTVERVNLTAPMIRFAAAKPALARLTGPDEFGDDDPMPPAGAEQVRAMLISPD
jgi:hypothetical protein